MWANRNPNPRDEIGLRWLSVVLEPNPGGEIDRMKPSESELEVEPAQLNEAIERVRDKYLPVPVQATEFQNQLSNMNQDERNHHVNVGTDEKALHEKLVLARSYIIDINHMLSNVDEGDERKELAKKLDECTKYLLKLSHRMDQSKKK